MAAAQLIAVRFPSLDRAEDAAASLRGLEGEHALKVRDAAVAVKHADDKVELRQTRVLAVGEGLVGGGAIGLLLGLPLGLPVAAALVGMAGGGGLSAFDRGISDSAMREAAQSLEPECALLFVLATKVDEPRVHEALAAYDGEVLASEAAGVPDP